MKTKFYTLLLITFLSYSSYSQNLLTNSSFETWTSTATMPDNWVRGAGTYGTNYLYSTDAVQGNVLNLVDDVSAAARRFSNTTQISIQSEGTYRATFKVKGNVGLRSVVLVQGSTSFSTTANGTTIHAASVLNYVSPTAVADWTEVTTDIVVPSTFTAATDYTFHLSWSHSTATKLCNFYIDDIQLAYVGLTTALNNATETTEVSILNNNIIFNVNASTPYKVFSVNGKLVKSGIANNGDNLELVKGVYILKLNNKTQKIVL